MRVRALAGVTAFGVLAAAAAGAAPPPTTVRLGADYAATDPGVDAFTSVLGRGGGLLSAGLPPFGGAVVSTESETWTGWATGFGRGTSVRARGGSGGELKSDDEGFVAGVDRRIGENAIVGFAAGYTHGGWRETGSPARNDAAAATVAAYGAAAWPDVVFGAAAVQYEFSDVKVGPGVGGRFSPGAVRAGGLVGHFIDLSGFTFTPEAELDYVHTDGGVLDLSQAGALAFEVPGERALTGRFGVRINSAFYRWGILGSPFLAILWERRFEAPDQGGARRPVTLEPSDATVAFGVTARLPDAFILGLAFGGRFGNGVDETSARLSLARGF